MHGALCQVLPQVRRCLVYNAVVGTPLCPFAGQPVRTRTGGVEWTGGRRNDARRGGTLLASERLLLGLLWAGKEADSYTQYMATYAHPSAALGWG